MILSVSRRTDVPNYYSDWFYRRIKEGFLYVRNPINAHQVSRIELSPKVVDCMVFWTKNPANMLEKLDCLKDYTYYFQFTITGYGRDIEPGLPGKRETLIPTFRTLSQKIGKERVIWRYDPIFISQRYTAEYHVKAFAEIARSLANDTKKVVISFGDFYEKTRRNLKECGIRQMKREEMFALAGQMATIASEYGLAIETCAEQIALESVGISHGSCVDQQFMEQLLGCALTGKKDKSQRQECGCLESIDVGTYDTCPSGCKYCYANQSSGAVKERLKFWDEESPLLCGHLSADDRLTVRKVKSLKDTQLSFFSS